MSAPSSTSTATETETETGPPAPLLRIEGLEVSYHTGRRTEAVAVAGVDLAVYPGEFVAVVGESGSGKSTTAHAVIGLLPEGGRITGGRITFGHQDVTGWSDRAYRSVRGSRIGLVPQDPTISLNPVMRVGDQIGETLRLHDGMGRRAARLRAVELLTEVGLRDPELRAHQFPHELSGGMRQRALLANAWACGPELVIADEPTSALDVTVQKQVLDRLDTLRRERGTAVLFITHDLGVALERADRVVVMNQGRVVETATAAELLENPREDYTRRLLASSPGLTGPVLGSAGGRPGGDVLLSGIGLGKRFVARNHPGGSIQAVDGVDIELRAGRTLALVGESGSGKSTTARMLARLEEPTSGTISYRGRDLTHVDRKGLRPWRRSIQFVYQSPYASLNPRSTVEDIVSEPLRAFKQGTRAERAETVARLIDQVALPASVLARRPTALSGGQRQRVAIARALALRPEILVLDEPVSALDASVQSQILQLLVDLRAEFGLTYLFITHDLAVVRQIADDVAVMRAGTVVEQGTAAELLSAPSHPYTQELLASVPGPGRGASAAQ